VLEGITRRTAIEIAQAQGIAVETRALSAAELRTADEVFLTSSGGGVLPVTRVDGRPAGLVTYAHAQGFCILQPQTEYAQDIASAKAADNVRCAAPMTRLARATTINALFSDAEVERARIDLGGNVLTVTSGALSIAKRVVIGNGTLTSGGKRPLIFAGHEAHPGARLAGSGGLVLFSEIGLNLGNAGNALTEGLRGCPRRALHARR
jgi:hypothetical protein